MTPTLHEEDRPEVFVRALGTGGIGIGTLPDGRVVFLPRTAPGDRVTVRVVQAKPKWARGDVVDWIERGPGRRNPPCPRYDECDGCSLQHLEYPEQLRWKGRIVGDALQRIGHLPPLHPAVEASPREFRYRNKITFTLRRLGRGKVVAGFRSLKNRKQVLDIGAECMLPEDEVIRAWEALRNGWGADARLLPSGRELRLTLRQGEKGVALLVKGGGGDGHPDEILDAVEPLSSVWRERPDGSVMHLAGAPNVRMAWLHERFELEGGGFVQVNRGAGEELHRYVLDELGPVEGKKIVDAYCGVGVLGRTLARRGGEVWGVEWDAASVSAAERSPAGGFRILNGAVEEELEGLLPAHAVLLNPPRTGIHEAVSDILRKRPPAVLIYTSCDPATLARDLSRIGGVLDLGRVRCFDLFPQTGHVETVVTMTRKDSLTL